jgi:hypothetical protein
MQEPQIILDWTDENITVEYDQHDGYHLNRWSRDPETGGWDVVRTDKHKSAFDAVAGALEWVRQDAENDRKIQQSFEEQDRERELGILRDQE